MLVSVPSFKYLYHRTVSSTLTLDMPLSRLKCLFIIIW